MGKTKDCDYGMGSWGKGGQEGNKVGTWEQHGQKNKAPTCSIGIYIFISTGITSMKANIGSQITNGIAPTSQLSFKKVFTDKESALVYTLRLVAFLYM